MSSYTDIIEDYKDSSQNYFSERNVYTEVHVLMLWWQENDIHPEKEIMALRLLLEQDFNYTVSSFEIPVDGSQQKTLNKRIIQAIEEHSRTSCLLVVYYAGHCDLDKKGNTRWASFELEGTGAELSWHVTQQLLFDAQGDVLLVLDCCNAASIAPGVKEEGRFEMIAACAKAGKTVAPSRASFTRILIKELKPHAAAGIYADSLAAKIRENKDITQTPVFHDFVQESSTKIWLQRLIEPVSQGFARKPAGYMVLRVDLADDIKGKAIAEWLKAAAPKQITAVEIEAVVLRARQLQDGAFATGSMLSNLSQSARNEILHALHGLHTTLASATHHAEDGPSQGDSRLVNGALDDIQRSISAVCDAVETPVLQDLDDAEQDIAGNDPFIAVTGTADAILLRKAVRGLSSEPASLQEELQIPFEQLHYRKPTSDLLRVVAMLHKANVIMEVFAYDYEPAKEAEQAEDPLQNVRRMTALLSQVERPEFRILHCRGFFYDRGQKELGLVFELPPDFDDQGVITSLLELYEKYPVMPLGHRMHLAYALAVGMDHLHRVGWVHKSYRSNNIVFCPSSVPKDTTSMHTEAHHHRGDPELPRWNEFDLSKPYIFGYDDARPQHAGTHHTEDYTLENNLYRHTERWGNPSVKFDKTHDIYALGIVLVEISLWKNIQSIILSKKSRPSSGRRTTSSEVSSKAKQICIDHLPHKVGYVFTQAIQICLDFGELTRGMNEYESQLFFQKNVTSRLKRAVGCI